METKKSKKARLDLHSKTFFLLGLVISLSISLLAFEYKSKAEKLEKLPTSGVIEWNEDVIQNTERPKPKTKLPKILYTNPEVVSNDTKVSDEPIIVYSAEIDKLGDLSFEPEDEEEYHELFVEYPSENPEFPGGAVALKMYLKQNIHYPQVAIDYGLEGIVYVQFTIGANGKVRDIIILRKTDPLLEKEAIRVVETMPKWRPAKQGINSVATYMRLPIKFILN